MKKNRLGSAEVGSCICYGLMALLQVGWLAVLLTAQLVPPVWVTLMVYCVALALFLLGQTLRVVQLTYFQNTGAAFSMLEEHTWLLTLISAVMSVVLGVAVASVWLWQMLKVSHTI